MYFENADRLALQSLMDTSLVRSDAVREPLRITPYVSGSDRLLKDDLICYNIHTNKYKLHGF